MTLNEINWVVESAAKYGIGGLIAGGILFLLLKNHISSYLSEKGKNLATKEYIAHITHLVKGVEYQYNVLIKEMEAKQQLRMAGLDKRLQAHQEAFTWWRKMLIVRDTLPKLVMEC